MSNILLVGKPNSGKSTLFNQLTGLNQKTGNYSGVTVAEKKGVFEHKNIIDIPGLQTLVTKSPEEVIARNTILNAKKELDSILFVANGMQMMDSLLLFSQVADLQLPTIVVINFSDEIKENKLLIDSHSLMNRLGCLVFFINSKNGDGLDALKKGISENRFIVPNSFCRSFYDVLNTESGTNTYATKLVQETNFSDWEKDYTKRKQLINSILTDTIEGKEVNVFLDYSNKVDRVLLHPFWGLLIFLFTLFLVFQSLFYISSFPMDWIDSGVSNLTSFAESILPTSWFSSLICKAVIPGIGGVLIFIPQIFILFFLIGVLEQTGYLSRISFLSDRFLRKFGLSGHSVIPLVSGWACAIPAIMSARIIDNPKERLVVILASPLMTCSARLPVYTILISVLFPQNSSFGWAKGAILLGLYVLGTFATLLVSYLSNKYLKVACNTNWVLELPVFRRPDMKNIVLNVYQKTMSFVTEAGKIIIAISIVLWVLSYFSPNDAKFLKEKQEFSHSSYESVALEYSYLGYLGKSIEPVIKPLGYDWKIGIALLSSFAAREVFVGTISSIYSIGSDQDSSIVDRLKKELNSAGKPVFSFATATSLLVFYVFAMQCMSTFAVVKKETNSWKYAFYQFLFMLFAAYSFSYLSYQILV